MLFRSADVRPGKILYIKPVLMHDEPTDIVNYSRTQPTFPHESTGDQFFSESQFESYQLLGWHEVDKFIGAHSPRSIADLMALASPPPVDWTT